MNAFSRCRADGPTRYLAATLDGLVAKIRTLKRGRLTFPQPSYALPSYAGMRLDADGRFQKFMQRWWNTTVPTATSGVADRRARAIRHSAKQLAEGHSVLGAN